MSSQKNDLMLEARTQRLSSHSKSTDIRFILLPLLLLSEIQHQNNRVFFHIS